VVHRRPVRHGSEAESLLVDLLAGVQGLLLRERVEGSSIDLLSAGGLVRRGRGLVRLMAAITLGLCAKSPGRPSQWRMPAMVIEVLASAPISPALANAAAIPLALASGPDEHEGRGRFPAAAAVLAVLAFVLTAAAASDFRLLAESFSSACPWRVAAAAWP